MGLSESVRIALGGLNANKMRSALTMLGVIIGVGAVITMVSIGEGAKKQVTSQIQALGSNLLIVMPGRPPQEGGVRGARGAGSSLTNDIWEDLAAKCPSVQRIAPETSRNFTVKSASSNTNTSIVGVTPGWDYVRNTKVAQGSFISEADQKYATKVALVGKTVVTDLFGGANPIGQNIRINGSRFTIAGVLESKGQQGFTDNDDRILVPLSTYQRKLQASKAVRTIYIQVKDEKLMDQAMNEVKNALAAEIDSESFSVMNQAEILNTAEGTTNTLTYLLAGIAAVSLLVGGIGIMNIMLVSVTERTREIGLRKAIGARRSDVLLQFIIESVTLSLLGGIIGIVFGFGSSLLVSKIAGWATAISLSAVLIAFGFSAAIGLFFGVYPASQASRLNPIEALRYE